MDDKNEMVCDDDILGQLDDNASLWWVEPCKPEFGDDGEDRVWLNGAYNFDNFVNAFVASMTFSLGGWRQILSSSVDSVGADVQPIQSHSLFAMLYVYVGVIIFGLYLMNLFAGIVYESYVRSRCIMTTGYLLSTEERRWLDMEELINTLTPLPVLKQPKWAIFRDLRRLQEEGVVDAYVAVLLLVNFFTMTLTHRGQPTWLTIFQQVINIITTFAFGLELVFKLISFGLSSYIRSGENLFDALITITAFIDAFEQFRVGFGRQQGCRITGVCRTLRVFRLISTVAHYLPTARKFITAIGGTMKKVWALVVVYFMCVFVSVCWYHLAKFVTS